MMKQTSTKIMLNKKVVVAMMMTSVVAAVIATEMAQPRTLRETQTPSLMATQSLMEWKE